MHQLLLRAVPYFNHSHTMGQWSKDLGARDGHELSSEIGRPFGFQCRDLPAQMGLGLADTKTAHLSSWLVSPQPL